jgi:excinuclease ABC subunit C
MEKISLNEIPNKPGIYIFKDDYDEPIYVGKAKNLRKRVPSYFNKNTSWKTKRLTSEAKSIAFVVSENEANALLAEYSFIQEYKPKYNIQFKDDKSYPYVTITNEEWPRAFVTRNIQQQNINFGPFPFIGAAKRSLDHLINIFPVRTCTKNTFDRHNKLNKPCLLYEIDKCSGPCVDLINKNDYKDLLSNLKEFYRGNSDTYINQKIEEMTIHSNKQEFEEANKIKITLKHLENARVNQTLMTSNDKNVDVIGIDIGRYDVVLSCLLIRNGRIVGEVKNNFEPMNVKGYENYLPQIIINLFEKNMPSNEVLVSHEFPLSETIQKKLENKWNKKITLSNPKRGWKKDLLNTAINDAKELRRVADLKRRSDLEFRSLSLEQLQHKLNLKKIPYRIEAYDISNLGDKFRVGSMVVMEDGIPKPSMYRKFHIKSFKGQDDFRSMEEIIFRRAKRLINNKEKDQSFRRNPDLILIDGGKGQLSKAKSVIDHFKLDIDVIGIAKKEEELFTPNKKSSIILNSNSEALFILQNIRDEAHRFAIQENRRLRLKDLDIDTIFEIKGVTKTSIAILLDKYKTLNKLSTASYIELSNLVEDKQAKKVYEYFNK